MSRTYASKRGTHKLDCGCSLAHAYIGHCSELPQSLKNCRICLAEAWMARGGNSLKRTFRTRMDDWSGQRSA